MRNDQTGQDTVPDLHDRIAALKREHSQFRSDVRAEILERHFDGPWCLSGCQDVLHELDLPPISRRYTGRATVRVDIHQVHDADTYGEAVHRVVSALDVTSSDDRVEYTVTDVEPVLADEAVRD